VSAAPETTDDPIARQIADWLIDEGRFLTDNGEILVEVCERLIAAGLPLERVSLNLRALHPRYRGVMRVWRPGQPVDERFIDHGYERTASYLESPMRAVVESHRLLEWRLDGDGALPFALLEEMREEGYTHYVIAPLAYASGAVNAFSWATKRPGGFAAEDLRVMSELIPPYTVVVETKALVRFIESLLSTYVGHQPSQLILEGQVRRGDIRNITAALMLIDLRDFTLLTDRLPPRAVIRLLNDYFDCVFPAVHRQGGEIMEIMGDGVLAMFQHDHRGSAAEACRAALTAAQQALAAIDEYNRRQPAGAPLLHAGIALHYGTVSYGNIGSGDRLDFTVIGPDVNLVSRIEQFCRQLDRNLIMSQALAEQLERPVWEIGHYELRGFAKLQRLFELPEE
jgi:adenylate cyclase